MPERRLVVVDPAGLHARPAARFIQVASRFQSTVTIRVGDRTADAKSLIAVLGLTVRPGVEIVLATAGADAEVALEALTAELEPYLAGAQPAPTDADAPVAAPTPAPRIVGEPDPA